MQVLNLSIPDEILFEMKSIPHRGATTDDKLRFSLAVGMFVSGDISLAKAAQLSGKNLQEFMLLLKGLNIPAFHYTEDMLEEDLKFAGM
jgi:predicted HTH domain antitoxin